MADLPSDVLLTIFKQFNSLEMVRILGVCKDWLEIIDENQTLWRRLKLPVGDFGRWPALPALELFSRKTEGTLQEVSMEVDLKYEEVDPFIKTLERSKKTLRKLSVLHPCLLSPKPAAAYSFPDQVSEALVVEFSELAWKLPNLVECEVFECKSNVRLLRGTLQEKHQDQGQESPNLKVLSIFNSILLFESHLNLLDNISSLSVGVFLEPKEWRRILSGPSSTLKHLNINIGEADDEGVPSLNFPRLQVLEICSTDMPVIFTNTQEGLFPVWMRIPLDLTLMLKNPLSSIPSVSTCWISHSEQIKSLAEVPKLEKLVVNSKFHSDDSTSRNKLLSFLRERKEDVAAGFKVDGVQMIPLKILVIPRASLSSKFLSALRELVGEVVDLESRFVEVEV